MTINDIDIVDTEAFTIAVAGKIEIKNPPDYYGNSNYGFVYALNS